MATDPSLSLQSIFLEAAEMTDPAARADYLRRVCGEDSNLRARVDALLAADAAAPPLPAAGPASPGVHRSAAFPPPPPARIGRYGILQKIGEGGYGTVFLAQQDEPVKRRVALKVVKLGMDTRQIVTRFEAERQALAMMDHPNIAKVFDAGTTESGQPFFVMEWVQGARITDFCDSHRLDLHQRVRLFLEVCQAVLHAHQKGILHRDLKPSNILVSQPEGTANPVPKVIDFGIAKALSGRLTDETLHTAGDQMIGTPAYMSPEQAAGGGQDIDTRSDIYSLGVLLYQMLTGETPFETSTLLAAGLDEMRRKIRETEPERPSRRLRHAGCGNTGRDETAIELVREAPSGPLLHIPEDLDWIVMKCLEKDRTRRYETVNALSRDLQRWLKDETVSARPPSGVYRVRKWMRRHRTVFAAGCAVLVSLLAGLALSTRMYVLERRARGEVEAQRALVERQRRESQQHAYGSDMKLAQYLVERFDTQHALEMLERHRPTSPGGEDFRGFEWRELWQRCQGSPHDFFPESVGMPWVLAASPNGEFLAVGSGHRRSAWVLVWKVATREVVARLDDDPTVGSDVAGAVFSPDGRWLATACHYRVKFFEVGTWREHPELTLTNTSGPIDWRGDTLISTPAGYFEDATQLDGLVLWDLRTRTPRLIEQALGPPALSPDGRRLAVRTLDGIEVRSVASPAQRMVLLEGSKGVLVHGSGYGSLKRALAFSPDGHRIAAPGRADEQGNIPVMIWDAVSGRRLDENQWVGHAAPIHGLSWSPDGGRVATASADGTVRIWDLSARNGPIVLTGHLAEPWCVTFSPQGNEVFSSSISTWIDKVKIWSLESREAPPEVQGEWYPMWLSNDGSRVFAVSGVDTAVYRERVSGRILRRMEKPAGMPPIETASVPVHVMGDENGPAAFLGFTGGQVASWCIASNQFPRLWPAHTGSVRSIATLPRQRLLLTGGDDGWMRWWSLEDGRLVRSNFLARPVTALAVSPDGTTVMSSACTTNASGSDGPSFSLGEWDADTGRRISLQDLPGYTFDLGFSPDGTWLAACVGGAEDREETHLLKLSSRRWTARLDRVGRRLDFSPDGSHLLIWSTLWDLREDPPVAKSLSGHRQKVHHQTFSPDSRTVVSTSDDGTVRLWNVATGQEMLSFAEPWRSFSYPVFSPDGTTLAVGSFSPGGRPIRSWHVPTSSEIDRRIREGRINQ